MQSVNACAANNHREHVPPNILGFDEKSKSTIERASSGVTLKRTLQTHPGSTALVCKSPAISTHTMLFDFVRAAIATTIMTVHPRTLGPIAPARCEFASTMLLCQLTCHNLALSQSVIRNLARALRISCMMNTHSLPMVSLTTSLRGKHSRTEAGYPS